MKLSRGIGFWVILCLCLPVWFGFDLVESDDPTVAEANKKFRQQKYEDALELYNKAAEEHGPGPILHFNRGATLERLGKHKEAMEEYLKGLSGADDELKARNYYNMGNTLMAQQKVREAIDSYKRSLRLKPGDEDAVFNLELAQYLLKKAEEEAKKRQEQQKQEGQENKEGQQEGQGDQQQQQEQQEGEQDPQGEKENGEQGQQNEDQNGEEGQKESEKQQAQPEQGGEQEQPQPQAAQEAEKQGEQGEDEQQAQGEEQEAQVLHPEEKSELEQKLDSMQENEKAFQLFRLQAPGSGPGDPTKDY